MHYYAQGNIPRKRHTVFRRPNGELYAEELVSTEGFSSIYSLVYHLNPPTRVLKIDAPRAMNPEIAVAHNMQHRCYEGFNAPVADSYLEARRVVLSNADVQIALAAPKAWGRNSFFKNADGHEMIFVHRGTGALLTPFGKISFEPGLHLMIPKGTVYQLSFDTEDNRLFIVESRTPFRVPKRYLNATGQFLEHAPFCERDIRKPVWFEPIDETGDFLIQIKKEEQLYGYHYANHPFDYAGWDGHLYPYGLSIHDFEPITGRLHQPPPVHQTFETEGFVCCAFVPRLYDYHPEAIPAPYHHSNIDSDEVLYYVDGDFMSRKHVTQGMITLHPMGIPHGPQPGAIERSIGARDTQELAVMVDTFRPLQITEHAMPLEQQDYYLSWL